MRNMRKMKSVDNNLYFGRPNILIHKQLSKYKNYKTLVAEDNVTEIIELINCIDAFKPKITKNNIPLVTSNIAFQFIIREIYKTNTLKIFKEYEKNDKIKLYNRLTKLSGFYPDNTVRLINKYNLETMIDVRENFEVFTHSQKTNLLHNEIHKYKVKHSLDYIKTIKQLPNLISDIEHICITGELKRNKKNINTLEFLLISDNIPSVRSKIIKSIDIIFSTNYVLIGNDEMIKFIAKTEIDDKLRPVIFRYVNTVDRVYANFYYSVDYKTFKKLQIGALELGYKTTRYGFYDIDKKKYISNKLFNNESDIILFHGYLSRK